MKRVVNTYHWLVGHGAVLQEDTDDLRLSKLGGQEERGYPIVIRLIHLRFPLREQKLDDLCESLLGCPVERAPSVVLHLIHICLPLLDK